MSTTLFMQAVPRAQPPVEPLDYELKKTIAKRYWDHDGSLSGCEMILDSASATTMAYLEGLDDAGVPGASDLLAALIEHGAVTIWIA